MIKTIVVTYKSHQAMQKDIDKRERNGYAVMGVTRNGQGWGVAKTVILGAIFLPLAIFGKKGDIFQVTYQFDTSWKRPSFREQISEAWEEGKNRW